MLFNELVVVKIGFYRKCIPEKDNTFLLLQKESERLDYVTISATTKVLPPAKTRSLLFAAAWAACSAALTDV